MRDDVEKALREVIPKFLNDPRTITFTVHRNIEDASKFFTYEKYESREALRDHSQTEHFKAFGQAIREMLAGPPNIGLYDEVA